MQKVYCLTHRASLSLKVLHRSLQTTYGNFYISIVDSTQSGYTGDGDREPRERTLFNWHHSNSGRAKGRIEGPSPFSCQTVLSDTVTPLLGLPQLSSGGASLANSFPTSAHKSSQSPPQTLCSSLLCDRARLHLQKGYCTIPEILKQYIPLSRDFFFFLN